MFEVLRRNVVVIGVGFIALWLTHAFIAKGLITTTIVFAVVAYIVYLREEKRK